MSILLLTSTGLVVGSLFSWVVEKRPHILSTSAMTQKEEATPPVSTSSFLFVLLVSLSFYGLSVKGFSTLEMINSGFLFSIISTIAFFDLRYQLIPNRLIVVGIIGWICLASLKMLPVADSLIAGFSIACLLFLIRLLGFLFYNKAGMGIGDIKLVFLMGLFLQWEVFWVLYLAIFSGAIWAVSGILLRRLGKHTRLPFAPFLWIGSSFAVFIFSFQAFLSLWM